MSATRGSCRGASGRVIDEAVVDAGYGFAWADDSASFIYMGVDDAWRACDVWLHRVGTPREADELLLVEPDEGFEMGFAPSGSRGTSSFMLRRRRRAARGCGCPPTRPCDRCR